MTDVAEGLAGCLLMTLLLGVACALACLYTTDDDGTVEHRTFGLEGLVEQVEGDGIAMLLTPLKDGTLVIGFMGGHLINLYVLAQHTLLDEPVADMIAAVEIDGAHKSLESIAIDETIVRLLQGRGMDEGFQPHLMSHTAQSGTLHHTATRRGEETLATGGITVVEDIGADSTQDGITQVLKPFVVGTSASAGISSVASLAVHRAVHERLAVERYITGAEANDAAQRAAEWLVVGKEQTEMFKRAQCSYFLKMAQAL